MTAVSLCGMDRKQKSGLEKGELVAYQKATEQVEFEKLGRNFKSIGKQSNRLEESWTRRHFEDLDLKCKV